MFCKIPQTIKLFTGTAAGAQSCACFDSTFTEETKLVSCFLYHFLELAFYSDFKMFLSAGDCKLLMDERSAL